MLLAPFYVTCLFYNPHLVPHARLLHFQVVDFEREGEAIRRGGDLSGVSGLRMTSLARSIRDMTLETELASKVSEDTNSDDDGSDGDGEEESFAFRLPGLPGAVVGGSYVPDVAAPAGHRPSEDSDTDSSSEDDEGPAVDDAEPFVVRFGTKEERKAHKAAVKEANRLKRKEKVPKHVKKRKEKIRKQTR